MVFYGVVLRGTNMILITSANYVDYGLSSEFGRIPPCMLPVQNKRLYEHQCSLLKSYFNESIYLSLPSDYKLPEFDEIRLSELGVNVIRIKPSTSLLSSVNGAIAIINKLDAPLRILFGDTLFDSLECDENIYLYATPNDDYKWDYSDRRHVYCGFFSLSDQRRFQALIGVSDSFIDAIEKYNLKGIPASKWLDFGLQNTYYRSITSLTTQRSFNSLNINKFSVIKRSDDARKMNAESNWFLNAPHDMRKFVPSVWDTFEGGYEIEYFYLSSLANVYVYGENSYSTWQTILNACNDFICTEIQCVKEMPVCMASINNQLFTEKTRSRILKYAQADQFDLSHKLIYNGEELPSVNDIINELDRSIEKDSVNSISVMHGDFCFSNILYDFKSQSVKVIDPRGLSGDGKELSIYGDIRYDIAKLAHSIIGKYDFIIAGRFKYSEDSAYDVSLKIYDNDNCKIIDYFLLLMNNYGITPKVIYPIMINLFLSMLPLHSDNKLRQKALFANALRLYLEYKSL